MAIVDEAKLGYLDFLSREDRVRHHRYVEEMKQYDMMRSGDINAISESAKLWDSGLYGHLSDDPLKNAKYRFVTTITLATRFAIEGGMDAKTHKSLSKRKILRYSILICIYKEKRGARLWCNISQNASGAPF